MFPKLKMSAAVVELEKTPADEVLELRLRLKPPKEQQSSLSCQCIYSLPRLGFFRMFCVFYVCACPKRHRPGFNGMRREPARRGGATQALPKKATNDGVVPAWRPGSAHFHKSCGCSPNFMLPGCYCSPFKLVGLFKCGVGFYSFLLFRVENWHCYCS